MRTSAVLITLALALPLSAQNPVTAVTPSTKKPAVIKRPVAPTARAAHKTRVAAKKPVAKSTPKVVAAVVPAPYSQNPIQTLKGNAHALLVFAPDSALPALRQQIVLLDHHSLDLSEHNTVLVPIITLHNGPDNVFTGENLNPGSYRDQLAARQKFGIKYNDFAVILLDEDGDEQFRSTKPLTIAEINAHILPGQ